MQLYNFLHLNLNVKHYNSTRYVIICRINNAHVHTSLVLPREFSSFTFDITDFDIHCKWIDCVWFVCRDAVRAPIPQTQEMLVDDTPSYGIHILKLCHPGFPQDVLIPNLHKLKAGSNFRWWTKYRICIKTLYNTICHVAN